MAMVPAAAAAEYFAPPEAELRLTYALRTCTRVAATAKGGQTLTPFCKVWRQAVRRETFVVLVRRLGTVIRESLA